MQFSENPLIELVKHCKCMLSTWQDGERRTTSMCESITSTVTAPSEDGDGDDDVSISDDDNDEDNGEDSDTTSAPSPTPLRIEEGKGNTLFTYSNCNFCPKL